MAWSGLNSCNKLAFVEVPSLFGCSFDIYITASNKKGRKRNVTRGYVAYEMLSS